MNRTLDILKLNWIWHDFLENNEKNVISIILEPLSYLNKNLGLSIFMVVIFWKYWPKYFFQKSATFWCLFPFSGPIIFCGSFAPFYS